MYAPSVTDRQLPPPTVQLCTNGACFAMLLQYLSLFFLGKMWHIFKQKNQNVVTCANAFILRHGNYNFPIWTFIFLFSDYLKQNVFPFFCYFCRCGEHEAEGLVLPPMNALMGLGRSPVSIPAQLERQGAIGEDVFAHCLSGEAGGGYLTFGTPRGPKISYVPLGQDST